MTFSTRPTVSTFFAEINSYLSPTREKAADIVKVLSLGNFFCPFGSKKNIIFPFTQSDNLNFTLLTIFFKKSELNFSVKLLYVEYCLNFTRGTIIFKIALKKMAVGKVIEP